MDTGATECVRETPGTILLVEDNADDRFFITRSLRRGGVEQSLRVVTDGQRAIEYLSMCAQIGEQEPGIYPSMVLLDLNLPRVNGFEVLEWMKAQQNLRPIATVVLSSSADERDQKRAMELGARYYLVKHPSHDELSQVVRAHARAEVA